MDGEDEVEVCLMQMRFEILSDVSRPHRTILDYSHTLANMFEDCDIFHLAVVVCQKRG